jgi:uncharacterized protein
MIDLSEPGTLDQLRLDPIRFLRDLATPAVVDEAQLEPQLLVWVKRVVDERDGRPAQFVLTGSARLGRTALGGSDPLAGRAVRLQMSGLTEQERARILDPAVHRLFIDDLERARALSDDDGWLRGGLPGVPGVLRPASAAVWERSCAEYVEAVVPLGAASGRVDHARLMRAFRYFAANPGQLLNIGRAANDLSVTAATVRSYLEQLEASFLLQRAEAHRPAEHKVLTAHPRVYATDTGLASWAMRVIDQPPTPVQLGSLLENRVATALSASIDWRPDRILLRHWRDERAKNEVDLLAIHPDGRTVAIEVKAAVSVSPSDTSGLVAYAAANRDHFHRGVLVYQGERVVDLSPPNLPARSIVAIPIGHLLG